MKTTIQKAVKKYPYLATYIDAFDVNGRQEVLVVNIQSRQDSDNVIWVQPLDANRVGWVTKKEDDYIPLPAGTTITLTQD